MNQPIKLAIRTDHSNRLHHLWNNNGTWWCHLTVHEGRRAHRVRCSLKTRDLDEACRKRDRLFARLSARERQGLVVIRAGRELASAA